MKKTKNMSVKICRKCGTINSALKEHCENCAEELSEPMSQKRASIEIEIIGIEKRINEKSGNRNGLTKGETSMVRSHSPGVSRGLLLGLVTGPHREKRTLKRLKKRLERIEAKEEKASARNN